MPLNDWELITVLEDWGEEVLQLRRHLPEARTNRGQPRLGGTKEGLPVLHLLIRDPALGGQVLPKTVQCLVVEKHRQHQRSPLKRGLRHLRLLQLQEVQECLLHF